MELSSAKTGKLLYVGTQFDVLTHRLIFLTAALISSNNLFNFTLDDYYSEQTTFCYFYWIPGMPRLLKGSIKTLSLLVFKQKVL